MAEYIDQSAAIARLTHLEVTMPTATMTDAKRTLADMFPADVVKVVHGRWVCHDDGVFTCSECGNALEKMQTRIILHIIRENEKKSDVL